MENTTSRPAESDDSLYLQKVAQARRMTMTQRFLAGAELFDMSLVMMRAGIRSQWPDFTEEQVTAEVRRRLAIARRRDDGDRYRPVDDATDD